MRDNVTYTCLNHIELLASTVFSIFINEIFKNKYENLILGS